MSRKTHRNILMAASVAVIAGSLLVGAAGPAGAHMHFLGGSNGPSSAPDHGPNVPPSPPNHPLHPQLPHIVLPRADQPTCRFSQSGDEFKPYAELRDDDRERVASRRVTCANVEGPMTNEPTG